MDIIRKKRPVISVNIGSMCDSFLKTLYRYQNSKLLKNRIKGLHVAKVLLLLAIYPPFEGLYFCLKLLTYVCRASGIDQHSIVQVNLCQKLFFLQNMGENMLCTKIVLNVRNNFCTQLVLPRFELGIFMYCTTCICILC